MVITQHALQRAKDRRISKTALENALAKAKRWKAESMAVVVRQGAAHTTLAIIRNGRVVTVMHARNPQVNLTHLEVQFIVS